jgi:RHS repeat-associated protein
VELDGRTVSGGYRYGFQNQEKDNEVNGKGRVLDFENRIYDPRIGKFLCIDRLTGKYVGQSGYVFCGNTPIWAIDAQGDSVLFYSKSGIYLGYSNDNTRYKGKNLLCFIDDKNVASFKKQYIIKTSGRRDNNPKNDAYTESITAGLEGMGITLDVTDMTKFVKKYTYLVGKDKDHTSPTPPGTNKNGMTFQQEWSTDLRLTKNPVIQKMNWVTTNPYIITTEMQPNACIPEHGSTSVGDLHLHTEELFETPSEGDRNHNASNVYNTKGRLNIFIVGQDNKRDNNFSLIIKIATSIPQTSEGMPNFTTIRLDKNSFKNPGKK